MYTAVVAKIHVRPFPPYTNDKGKIEEIRALALGNCLGNQVIVAKDTSDNTLGVFFPCDGQLSEEFAKVNDLIKRKDPETGKQVGGMFDENRRVRSIKLKGAKSDGFWVPLNYFIYTGADLSSLKEGDMFDSLNEHPICNKYLTKATREARTKNVSLKIKKANNLFYEHIETGQFRNEAHKIQPGALIHISEKEHGTSGRFGLMPEKPLFLNGWQLNYSRNFDLLKRGKIGLIIKDIYQHALNAIKKVTVNIASWLANKSGLQVNIKPYTYLNGSRRVILEYRQDPNSGFYGENGDNFRIEATKNISLSPGEMIYFELVGYTHNDNLIMNHHDTTKLKNKEVEKRFGQKMKYTYGCLEGKNRLRVYRITQMIDDGSQCGREVELPWFQMVKRAKELGLETVHYLESFTYDGNVRDLNQKIDLLVDGVTGSELIPSAVDCSHIREGVVVRVEQPDGSYLWLKNKSFAFGCLEGYLKERDDYIDAEEIA